MPAGTAATPTTAATKNATIAAATAASGARRSAAAAAACPNGGPWLAHYVGLVVPRPPLYKLAVRKKCLESLETLRKTFCVFAQVYG